MNIKSIELVLENCETIVLKYPDVGYFDINGQYTSFSNYMNAICKNQCINGFTIGIKSGADLSESNCFSSDGKMSIERLKLRDVTQVEITYDDDSKDHYMVSWDCENDQLNDKQVFELTPDENHIFYSYTGDAPLPDKIMEIKTSIDFLVDMNR